MIVFFFYLYELQWFNDNDESNRDSMYYLFYNIKTIEFNIYSYGVWEITQFTSF